MNAKANTDPPRILRVGLRYGLPDVDGDDFYTDKHFLDYDIVIMDPQGALIGPNHDYTNRICDDVLSQELGSAETFQRRYVRITQKLVEFVNDGGLAIVFLRPMPTLKYEVPGRYRWPRRAMPWPRPTSAACTATARAYLRTMLRRRSGIAWQPSRAMPGLSSTSLACTPGATVGGHVCHKPAVRKVHRGDD